MATCDLFEPPHEKKQQSAHAKTKRRGSTAKLISTFVFAKDSTIPLLSKIQNFKLLAIYCDDTDQFVSDLFGNYMVGLS